MAMCMHRCIVMVIGLSCAYVCMCSYICYACFHLCSSIHMYIYICIHEYNEAAHACTCVHLMGRCTSIYLISQVECLLGCVVVYIVTDRTIPVYVYYKYMRRLVKVHINVIA